ncbi:hypothetical protein [Zavarzinella formosa]|uniref:hypothetical protein n=1 Tax=Zavarzinella formosa TaxID=360055 RepID=UPI0002D3D2CF|nr:hypothetical protein [Zavarzinella formosa]
MTGRKLKPNYSTALTRVTSTTHLEDADSSPFENLSSDEWIERQRTGPTPGEDTGPALKK